MSGEMTLEEAIDKIESSYEFMLAYAAQGRDFESSGGDGPPIRQALRELRAGLALLGARFEERAQLAPDKARPGFSAFCAILKVDSERAIKAIDLVLSVGNIGSQLIDNLNASLHLRALLTDMFLLDEACKSLTQETQH